jgi:dihydroneopterin aldolase
MAGGRVNGDRITLTGLRGYGHHGVFPHERREGQEFVVDVEVALDTRPAAHSDDVADTVHYGELAEDVVAVVEGEPVDLVETLAQRIADAALSRPAVMGVRVTVHKPSAPITVPFADVTVTIERTRS